MQHTKPRLQCTRLNFDIQGVFVPFKIQQIFFITQKFGEDIMSLPQPITGQAFRLTHPNMESILIYVTEVEMALKWLSFLREAITGGIAL